MYVLGEDGNPRPIRVTVGETNGSETEIVGGDLRDGMEVITSRLAAGQTQDKSGQRGGERARPTSPQDQPGDRRRQRQEARPSNGG